MASKLSPQLKILLIYLILGALWIYGSDRIIALLFDAAGAITLAQNIKGWAFVAVTGGLLYFLVKKDFDALVAANKEVIDSYEQTITGWIQVMDLRHQETKNHTERVTRMTLRLAERAGITDEKERKRIEQGAILHDIGKIGIPDEILIKPDRLNEREWDQIKLHPLIGYEILSRITFLESSLDIPYCHHEKWNGQGYPRGLAGQEIPLAARLFAVVDVWDALSHARVYKPAWQEEEVLGYLREEAGRQFDPDIVTIFLENYEQIIER